MSTDDAQAVSAEFVESARAAVARGENLQTLALAHLHASMTLMAMANPAAGLALSQAVTQAGKVLGKVADQFAAGQLPGAGAN